MRFAIFYILLLAVIIPVRADISFPDSGFAPGWQKAGSERIFTAANLYGHINGGAELFIELGFKKVRVQKYKKSVQQLGIEIYQMQSPESALGIYLQKVGRENPRSHLDARNSCNRYQYILYKGACFIQINNFAGDSSLMTVMDSVAEFVARQLEMNEVKILHLLPNEHKITQSEKIIRGPFSLQSIYTFGRGDILNLQGKIFGVSADYLDKDSNIFTHILIPYPDEPTAHNAFQNLVDNLDLYLEKVRVTEKSLLFKDYQNKYGYIRLKKNNLKIDVGMKDLPQPDGK